MFLPGWSCVLLFPFFLLLSQLANLFRRSQLTSCLSWLSCLRRSLFLHMIIIPEPIRSLGGFILSMLEAFAWTLESTLCSRFRKSLLMRILPGLKSAVSSSVSFHGYRPDLMEAGIFTPLSPLIIFFPFPPSSSLAMLTKSFFLGSHRCLGLDGAKETPWSSRRFRTAPREASTKELVGRLTS